MPLKQTILGVRFDSLTRQQAAQAGAALLEAPGFHYAVTPNPEFLLAAEKDASFRKILNEADLTLPDGIGVIYAARILGRPLQGRVTGIDFSGDLLARLNETGGRLYLLGAKPGVAQRAGENIQAQYPNLVLCGTHDGYFQDNAAVAGEIAQAGPDLLFVCLGAPKQEKWMVQWGPATGARLAIGLGGVLDVYSGQVERAPEMFQKLGLEWAYRLMKEPSRVGRMARLPLVLVKALKGRFTKGE